MKIITDKPITDRIQVGKELQVVNHEAGVALEVSQSLGDTLITKGAAHEYPKNPDEAEALKDAVKFPPVPGKP